MLPATVLAVCVERPNLPLVTLQGPCAHVVAVQIGGDERNTGSARDGGEEDDNGAGDKYLREGGNFRLKLEHAWHTSKIY